MTKGAESMVLSAQRKLTSGGGTAVFDFPAGMFDNVPVCTVALEAVGGNVLEARILAASTTQVTVAVRSSAFLTVLGVGVLGTANFANNIPVHLTAIEPENYI